MTSSVILDEVILEEHDRTDSERFHVILAYKFVVLDIERKQIESAQRST